MIYWEDSDTKTLIFAHLRNFEPVITVTDTIPGFLALCVDRGKQLLDFLKGRSEKPYLVLIPSKESFFDWADVTKIEQKEAVLSLARCFWPGPLTLIVPARPVVPHCARSASGAVALRIPHHKQLLSLLAVSGPLFSTSANKTGERAPLNLDTIDAYFKNVTPCIVSSREEITLPIVASTIVDCTKSNLRIVREGALSKATLERCVPRCWE